MLQVYDRVLGSRSEATLVALTVLVAFLYGIMGILDYARGRIMGRVGARFQARLDRRVFDAVVRKSAAHPGRDSATGPARPRIVQRLMSSPVLMAFFDIPWTPFFLARRSSIFHPWLGHPRARRRRGADRRGAGQPGRRPRQPARPRPTWPPSRRRRWPTRSATRPRWSSRWACAAPPSTAGRSPRDASLRGQLRAADLAGIFSDHDQDLPPVPAVGDAGPRRLPGAAGRDDAGRDDRRARS